MRLRPAWDRDTFLEEDAVVRTMLHEVNNLAAQLTTPLTISSPLKLTHNVHGPHDEIFYKFLAGLEDEYDALQRSGYAGEGFFSPGYRLGAGISHDLPPHIARVRALEAAERRRRMEALTQGGGTLGGRSSALDRLSPRELAARVSLSFSEIRQHLPHNNFSKAAEHRRRDEVSCGSGSIALREAAKAAKASAVDKVMIDLTNGRDDPFATRSSGSTSGSSRPRNGQWTCPTCTLVNRELALQCDACLSVRPSGPTDTLSGWTCTTCGERDIPYELRSCRFCGAVKSHS